ncbi:MAG: hypothetical protein AAF804_11855 [Bacteroidota bacterium]
MSSDNFEHKLSQKLQQARMVPPPGLFEAIEANLPDAPPLAKRRPLFWWWAGGAGMLAVAAAFALMMLMRTGDEAVISSPTTKNPVASTTQEPAQTLSPSAPAASTSPSENRDGELSSPKELPNSPQATHSAASETAPPQSLIAQASPSPGKSEPLVRNSGSKASTGDDNPDFAPAAQSAVQSATQPIASPPLEAENPLQGQGASPAAEQTATLHVAGIQINDALFEQLAQAPPTLPGVAYEQTPWIDLRPEEVAGDWYSRLAFQPEYAGRGNPLQVFSTPNVDHSLLESDQRFISQQAAPVHVVNYPRQRFTTRIFIGKPLGPKLSLEAGIALSLSEQGRYRQGLSSPELLINGPVTADMAVREFSVQHLWQQNYIELPVRLNYQIWRRGAHGLSIQAGLAANRTLQNLQQPQNNTERSPVATSDFSSNDGLSLAFSQEGGLVTSEEVDLLRIRPWHSHFAGGIQYERQMGQGYRLYLGPSAKYLLTGAYGGQAATGQMRYYLGVEMGLRLGQ